MDIKEMSRKRRELENEVGDLLSAFEVECGIRLSKVNVTIERWIPTTGYITNPQREIIVNVELRF